ncbi:hypothetical protein CC86DRAFT_442921 [Ophiobolus disseminans]|uniref:C3H1-type domain-containing protein n=1 Tax=Ophiobolus disseminans TaxID=1469910 RepID=A0A6A7AEI0_9PLEO|nr:hypothetical protein CC86DRAFT_442921 [Ophiobolus disseminans]
MVPPGRPIIPYTAEDIKHITDPQARVRAMAELSSFIVRMKQWNAQYGTGAPSQVSEAPAVMTPFRTPQGRGVTSDNNNYQEHDPRPQRGGFSRGRGGHSGYHPYARPANCAPYRNRSVAFNNSDTPDNDTSDSNEAATPTENCARPEERHQQQAESELLCPAFTSTGKQRDGLIRIPSPLLVANAGAGICSRYGCRRVHDPDKQAICRSWLYKGNCRKGDACGLSHTPTAHNAPTCQHFQEGRCTKDECRFSHVGVNPAALNCEAFGTMGYCEKGAECFELHAHECPHFSNTGSCFYGDNCRWGHVRRAARLRHAIRRSPEGPSSPPDTTEENLEDTVPVEAETETEIEIWIGPTTTDPSCHSHHFTQQADFVSLDA